jgi:AraC-like DNA-binding protein
MIVLLWIGAAQSIFSAIIFLLLKKDNSLANRILTAWMFIIAFEYLTTGIDFTTGINHLTNPFLIFNPLIYFYSKALTDPRYKLKWYQLWHVLPYLFVKTGSYIWGVEFAPEEFFRIDHSTWFKITVSIMSVISFIGYTIPSLVNVHRYRINLKNELSTIDSRITLGWLLVVIVFYMSFVIIAYALGIINIVTQIATYSQMVSFAFLLVLVYIFSFYGLLQGQLYGQPEPENEPYKNPRLTPAERQKIRKLLEDYFDTEKPYLNSELTINNVSDKLKLSRHALTEVLNSEIGLNFYRFVNSYRVKEVQKRLADPEYTNYSIDAIGFDCGFNSKSSFYSVFKKATGMTPAQYKKSLK